MVGLIEVTGLKRHAQTRCRPDGFVVRNQTGAEEHGRRRGA